MKVKLAEFSVYGVEYLLYMTDDPNDMDAKDEDDMPSGCYCVYSSEVYLSVHNSGSFAARSFFHELFELTLANFNFRYDPYHGHKCFSYMSDVLYSVFRDNSELLFGKALAKRFEEIKAEKFGKEEKTAAKADPEQRHWTVGGFVLHLDEIDYSRERQYPGSAHFTVKELPLIVVKVKDLVSARDGKWEDTVDTAVKEVMDARGEKKEKVEKAEQRHFEAGPYHFYLDEIEHSQERFYPGSSPFSSDELLKVVKRFRDIVTARGGKGFEIVQKADDINDAVREVMEGRGEEEDEEEARC